MSKKNEKAAPASEPEADPRAVESYEEYEAREEAEHQAALAAEAADAAEAARLAQPIPVPAAGPTTFEQWAEAKGHIKRLPPPGRPRGAYVLPGPDYRVVKAHTRWPANQQVSEAEYDAAVKDTYGQELRER